VACVASAASHSAEATAQRRLTLRLLTLGALLLHYCCFTAVLLLLYSLSQRDLSWFNRNAVLDGVDECIDQCAGELVEALLVQKYLFYWYKSANTDAGARAGLRADVDSHAAARAKGVFCRCSVYLLY
jgi:hypothetical protein